MRRAGERDRVVGFIRATGRALAVDGDDERTAITNTKAWDDEKTTLRDVQLRICSSH